MSFKVCLSYLLLLSIPVSVLAEAEPVNLNQLRQQALAFEHGRGVKQDYQQAHALYCQAALAGDAESAYNLGFMYFYGRGKARSLPMAMHWFKEAATGGDVYAKRMLVRFKDAGFEQDDPDCHPEPKLVTLPEIDTVLSPNQKVVASWVNQIAPAFDIDPELVMAVIQAESAFNTGALSNKNAQGLMQLIPETAERFGVKDVWNPVENIKGGVAYLHWLLHHFSGKVEWVLAAYNAGEGAVDRYQGIPPYHETQNYVKRILSRYPKTTHPIPNKRPVAATGLQMLEAF